MPIDFLHIVEAIDPPAVDASGKPIFSVVPVTGSTNYYIGKDSESLVCLLISTAAGETRNVYPTIRLESLDAQFDLKCRVNKQNMAPIEGTFTVIRCRDSDSEITRYFLSVCELVIRVLGGHPKQAEIANVVNRLAAIFQKIKRPPTRPLLGLFGELYLIMRSGDAVKTLSSWRSDERSRFDFSTGDVRLEVKVTTSRTRRHTFSYDQCNPPSGTIAVVASLQAEEASGGIEVQTIVERIEARITSKNDLLLKLHDTIASTLGNGLKESLSRRFDLHLAESSLRFFNLLDVPAIRGQLPNGVSDVHFCSDLSALPDQSVESLVDLDPEFWDLLPHGEH